MEGLDKLIPTLDDNHIIHGNLELTRGKIRKYIEELFNESEQKEV